MAVATVEAFIARWRLSGGGERSDYQIFLSELCDLLDVPRPEPSRGLAPPAAPAQEY